MYHLYLKMPKLQLVFFLVLKADPFVIPLKTVVKKEKYTCQTYTSKVEKNMPKFPRNFIAKLQLRSSVLYFMSIGFLCFPTAKVGMLSSTAWSSVCEVWPLLRGEVQASKNGH